ncbi:MAG: Ig-like domain-containing protein [Cyclobacteriaceae bacterium]
MRTKLVQVTGWYALFLATSLISCDPFEEDFIPKENRLIINENATEYYILANTPAVIDLNTIVTSLFTRVTMRISEDPTRGNLVFLNAFIFKYTPYPSFVQGDDQFTIEFTGEEVLLTTTITVHMTENTSAFPCSLYAVEDYSHAKPGKPVVIGFLDNDRICGIKTTDVTASISISPQHGHALILDGAIRYIPETDFHGIDEIVYTISARNGQQSGAADSLLVSHGLVRISVTSEDCPFFIFDSVILDLTDDIEDVVNTGECAGGYNIPVWGISIPPCDQYGYYSKQISQSNESGSVCSGTDGSFAYYPDPDRSPKDDTAKFEVCINGDCRQVTINIIREGSG